MKPKTKYILTGKKVVHLAFDFGGDDVSKDTLCGRDIAGTAISNAPFGGELCKSCQNKLESHDLDIRYISALARTLLPEVMGIEFYVRNFLEGAKREQWLYSELEATRKAVRNKS